MGLLQLYTSVSGRISRTTWWFGAISLGVTYFLSRSMLGLILRHEPIAVSSEGGLASLDWITEDSQRLYALANVALTTITCVLGYCLSVKRRHDRGAGGWDVAVVFGVPVVLAFFGLVRLLLPSSEVVAATGPDGFSLTVFLLSGYLYQPFALYVLVVLGLLKGTEGPNRFGPDPLAGARPTFKQEAS